MARTRSAKARRQYRLTGVKQPNVGALFTAGDDPKRSSDRNREQDGARRILGAGRTANLMRQHLDAKPSR